VSDPLEQLLDVQEHDTTVDQQRHRRTTLPARAELAAVQARLAELAARRATVGAQRAELGTRQEELESQIASSRARREEIQKRMFAGQAAPRDLQAMDEETKHLARHVTELEDRELEVMEALEPLDAVLGADAAETAELEQAAAGHRAALAEQEQQIDGEISAQLAARQEAAAGVPGPLLDRYEQLRAKLGGTGAARLVGNSCGGCHLVLPSMEVDRIRKAPPDAVITCDQCGRILVR
jgi:predicted  nucleic acid-binding Zn-ribbon protein